MFRLSALCLLLLGAVVPVYPAAAQDANPAPATGAPAEPSDAQMELARKVLSASDLSRSFDEILPEVADQAKMTLIRSNPQMQLGIIEIVDQVALDMVDRRAELEKRLARIWAINFSEGELNDLLTFFETDTGQKFTGTLVGLLSAQVSVSQAWAKEIGDEMLRRSTQKLQEISKNEAKSLQGETNPQ
ncbi:DUF2059 domain-containing protein [Afifella sp. H1R]|uniref:DUF2059 domain-containing protein n=1 Tax=unclassified Afifella TaxID=2624128 RepID=UPI001F34F0BA|nr:DUF2059 domain-containing protein [Afifella sp. H1R]MCF1505833.1 DUF2059 domain-containing protein [Afifella sp. H1R]